MDAEAVKLVGFVAAGATLLAAATTALSQFLAAWLNGRNALRADQETELRRRRAGRVDPVVELLEQRLSIYAEIEAGIRGVDYSPLEMVGTRDPSDPARHKVVTERVQGLVGRLAQVPLSQENRWREAGWDVYPTVMIVDIADRECGAAVGRWLYFSLTSHVASVDRSVAAGEVKAGFDALSRWLSDLSGRADRYVVRGEIGPAAWPRRWFLRLRSLLSSGRCASPSAVPATRRSVPPPSY